MSTRMCLRDCETTAVTCESIALIWIGRKDSVLTYFGLDELRETGAVLRVQARRIVDVDIDIENERARSIDWVSMVCRRWGDDPTHPCIR